MDRLTDFADQGLTTVWPYRGTPHGGSFFIQLDGQRGGDHATRQIVHFATVKRDAKEGTARTTAHTRVRLRHVGYGFLNWGCGDAGARLLPNLDGCPELGVGLLRPNRFGKISV